MNIFRTFQSSLYDPAFYKTMRERSTTSALGYFALLMLVVSIISSAMPVVDIATFIFRPSEEKDVLRNEVLSLYPDELVVRFENGVVSTNVAEPYAIPLPRALREEIGAKKKYSGNLLVIDTTKQISAGDFDALDTIAILGRDSIGFYDPEEKKVEIQSLERTSGETFTMDTTKFVSYVGIAERFAKWFGVVLLFLIPFLIFFAKFVGFLVYLLFGAFVIWIVAKVRGTLWDYGTAYKAGLHLVTLPMLYGIVSSAPFVPALHIPLLFTAILAIAAATNLAPAPQEPTAIKTDPIVS